jgi:hypothetical protein
MDRKPAHSKHCLCLSMELSPAESDTIHSGIAVWEALL